MAKRVTNSEINETLIYLKSKIEYAEKFDVEHRTIILDKICDLTDSVNLINGRVRRTEIALGWFKGTFAALIAAIAWLFNKS